MQISKAKDAVNFDNIAEANIANWRYIIHKKLWQKFGLDELMSKIQNTGETKFNLNDTCVGR